MSSIEALGERALIARLRQRVGPSPPHVPLGIGDDAAVLAPERGLHDVLTTDSLIEGIHFRRDWTAATNIGHKALAVNLSDLAAMGASPRASLLSLALPPRFPLADFDALLDGFVTLAVQTGAVLIGGNLTRSPGPLVVDVTAIGGVHPRRLLRRSGARPGCDLYVTGTLGGAAAGLAMLQEGIDRAAAGTAMADCIARHERPEPRSRCGRIVGRTKAALAAVDLSDGLADAARQIAEASGTGVVVEADALPVHDGARAWAARTGDDPIRLAIAGGEDYELAFAVSPRQRSRFLAALRRCPGLPITRVGRVTAEPGTWLNRAGRLDPLPRGFTHF